MTARRVGLLILVLAFGLGVDGAWSVRERVGFGPFGVRIFSGRFRGPSFTFEETRDQPVTAGQKVVVENAFGAVRVAQGPEGTLQVRLSKVVYREREEEARRFADTVHVAVQPSVSTVRVATNRDDVERGDDGRVGFETHLALTVPPGTAVVVRNEHGAVELADVAGAEVTSRFDDVRLDRVTGDVTVDSGHGAVRGDDLRGKVTVTARHGGVELTGVGGEASLDVEHGDVRLDDAPAARVKLSYGNLTAAGIRGALTVEAQRAGVNARGVTGPVRVTTSFQSVELADLGADAEVKADHGGVRIDGARGAVKVRASFDDVDLSRVTGAVDVTTEHGGVTGHDLQAGGRIEARGDSVLVDGFRGPLEVRGQNAGVELVPGDALRGAVTVSTTHGDVTLRVPAEGAFSLDARSTGGEVSADVPGLTTTSSERGRLGGNRGGGGPTVSLTAEHGDVRLETAPAPASPTPAR